MCKNEPYGKVEVELSMDEKWNLDELAKRLECSPEKVLRMALHDLAVVHDVEDGPWMED